MTIIYGIKNCDTMKKAFKWLNDNAIEYRFHDYRKDGLDEKLLQQIMQLTDWDILLNRRGTTWRKLPDELKTNINKNSAMQIMLAQPAIIKRPVLINAHKSLLGFKPEDYQTFFNQGT